MASVISFPSARGFQFTVKKAFTANMEEPWVNTYWAVSMDDGQLSDLVLLGRRIAEFERYCTKDLVTFISWSVRTGAWEDPHTSENFYTEPINQPGRWLSTGTHLLDKRVVMWLAKTAISGRQGRVFLRGTLTEEDVESVAGTFALTVLAAGLIAVRVATGVLDNLSPYLVGGNNQILRMCLIKPNGTDVRYIQEIVLNGVTIASHNHAYFDRGAGGSQNGPVEQVTLPAIEYTPPEKADWEPVDEEE